jgi:hypothetical protein
MQAGPPGSSRSEGDTLTATGRRAAAEAGSAARTDPGLGPTAASAVGVKSVVPTCAHGARIRRVPEIRNAKYEAQNPGRDWES